MTVKATGQVSLFNQNDALITGTAPSNPTNGSLWIDSSTTPYPTLKQWNGTAWVAVGEMDATLSDDLNTINTQLDNMTSDSIIDFTERQQVKQDISNIIGYVIADTATSLPSGTSLTAGSYYQVRQSAINAGVSTSNASYTALATAYTNLCTYLNAMTPKPWDAGLPNRNATITVDPTTWTQTWLNYYAAEDVLTTTTAQQLQANVTNINIGGRNLLTDTAWDDQPSAYGAATLTLQDDTPTNNVLVTATAGTGQGVLVGKGDATLVSGQQYTLSFQALVPQSGGAFPSFNYVYIMSASVGNSILSSVTVNTANKTTFQKCTLTFTASNNYTDAQILIGANYSFATNYTIKSVKLESGNKATDWSPAPEDASGQISDIDTRVTNAESNIEPDTISATVVTNDTFSQAISGKADSTDLSGYATNQDLTNTSNDANSYTDSAIASQDFSSFVTQDTLSQTTSGLTEALTMGGGVNLVKNSVGFAGTDMWTISGSVLTVQNDELTQLGFLSGFQDNGAVSGSLTQTIYTTIGQYYTISFYMRKDVDASTNGTLGTYVYDANNTKLQLVGLDSGQGTTSGYKQYAYTFLANTSTHTVVPTWGSATTGVITGIMVNIGINPLQWTMAPGELYNANIQFDMNGIQVSQTVNGFLTGMTVMTPDKFAGYFDSNNDGVIDTSDGSPDEVFRVDQDEFVMNKATVSTEITMGGLKVIQVASSASNGWAFVKYS